MTSYLYPKRSETWLSWRNFTFKGTDSLFCLLNLVRHELVLNTFLDQHPLYNPISQSKPDLKTKGQWLVDRNAKTNTHPSQPQKNTTHYTSGTAVHSNWLQICHLLCDWLEALGWITPHWPTEWYCWGQPRLNSSLPECLHFGKTSTHTHTHTHTHTLTALLTVVFLLSCSIPTI